MSTEERETRPATEAPSETKEAPSAPEPPPPGARAMALVRWLILVAAATVCFASWFSFARAERGAASAAAAKYQCPMHPQIVSDRPGECPICHMDLERIDDARLGAAAPPSAPSPAPASARPVVEAGERVFVCPMHPQVRSPRPGTCPICHMDLELLLPDGGTVAAPASMATPTAAPQGESSAAHRGHDHGATSGATPTPARAAPRPGGPAPASIPPGTTPIGLTLDRVQAIGVRTTVAVERQVGETVRAPAQVMLAEDGATEVHVRAAGFVEQLHVATSGVTVKAGQPLLALYSPELFQAQNELLAAASFGDDGTGGRDGRGAGVAAAARRKLELLGMAPKDIDRAIARREPLRAVPVYAPRGGVVTTKNVVLGAYVTPETTLYELQDLSRVYVVADVSAHDAGRVTSGTAAQFTLARDVRSEMRTTVDLIYPRVDDTARTTRVRMTVANPSTALRVGDIGTTLFTLPARRVVAVPRDAVIDTGQHAYVFVADGEGHFTPRVVVLDGGEGESLYVGAGIDAGTRVVSGATFLLDSESRVQASLRPHSERADAGQGGAVERRAP